ncbi:hypothetical protein [Staphylococcus hominis]
MKKDLTSSQIDRKNILNNSFAVEEIQKQYKLKGIDYKGTIYFTTQQIADFFKVDIRTIRRLIEEHEDELRSNDYHVLTGTELDRFRSYAEIQFANDIHVSHKTRNLGVSTVRTLLNFAMLLTNSEIAKIMRKDILDITINTIAEKTGGHTKYINQRDREYLNKLYIEETERKPFTDALKNYVNVGQYKYAYFTDLLYKLIFKESAREYKKILSLKPKDKTRETMYSEVLLVIASYEKGIAHNIEKRYKELNRQLTKKETIEIFKNYSEHPGNQPLLIDARTKMSSRDLGFRDALHYELEEYITPINKDDFEKFLGAQSKSLEQQIQEHKDVFLRLKDK